MGTINTVPLQRVNGQVLAAIARDSRSPQGLYRQVEATATLREVAGRLGAFTPHGCAGFISSTDRRHYSELDSLLSQGIAPEVSMHLEFDATGKPDFAALRLPRPGLCLPANNPPERPWSLFPPGPGIVLEHLPEDLGIDYRSHLQLLVKLRSTEKVNPPMVTAYVGGHVVGVFTEEDSARLAPSIVEHARHGVTCVARAYLAPTQEAQTLTIYAAPQPYDAAQISPPAPSQKEASSFDTTNFLAQQGPRNAAAADLPSHRRAYWWTSGVLAGSLLAMALTYAYYW